MIQTNYQQFHNDLGENLREFAMCLDSDIIVNGELINDNFYVEVIIDGNSFSYYYPFNPADDIMDKRFIKRFLKLSLYKALNFLTGKSMAWGSLTGIRPTKLAYQCMNNFGEYKNYFLKDMLVSKEKIELVDKTIQAQKPYYYPSNNNFNLFVSIPFCPSRCSYCTFLSSEIFREKRVNEYIEALTQEIEQSKLLIKNLRSVYVGGGTPVALEVKQLERVLKVIGKVEVEYTVEAGRPDCISAEKLQLLKEFGVTRICVNPQTFSNETLKRIGRRHTAEDVIEKYELAKKFGFDVNMDLIAGLFGESFEIFSSSLNQAVALSPENITVHTLALKRGSQFKESGKLPDGIEAEKMVDFAHHRLERFGYFPYYLYRQKYMAGNLENTGYSKPKKECVYNIDIMEEISQIVACGANSVSKRVFNGENRLERFGAPKDVQTYIANISKIIDNKNQLFCF